MKKNFKNVEDFLVDESFRDWVLNPNPEVDAYWNSWMKEHPDAIEMMMESKDLIRNLATNGFSQEQSDSDTKERILNNIKLETQDWNKPKRYYWLRAAVIALIAIGVGITAYLISDNFEQELEQVAVNPPEIKENPFGVKSRHTLTDGTLVYLNAGSSITYLKNFEQDKRIISLVGEAYFDVEHDAKRPFTVTSGDASVTVLGTEFNFTSFGEHPVVSLVEGKVAFTEKHSNTSVTLQSGQQVVFDHQQKVFTVTSFNKNDVTGWKDGRLTFRDASFDEVVDKLQRWYGVHISVSNKKAISEWSYTGSFKNESLESVLRNMSTMRDFEYTISDDSVTFSF